ncbi:hypothetical protein AU192_02490 [Mycobacterium lehmannii]|uniref:Uncharacterized protein n=1 Tax=Mycobacterium lehmannii TaxID=2048550 RepID=A0A101A921_9MYCO|nr:hypothetical protein [Mycobacterium lehmannii]KUI17753.1 hypothetical protein AU192_02490 [Mycobacterium lehmannii]
MKKIAIVTGGMAVTGLIAAAPASAEPGQVSCSPCAFTTTGNSYVGELVGGWAAAPGQILEGWASAPGELVQGWAEAPGKLVRGWAEAPGKLVQGWAEAPGKLVSGWASIPSKLGPQSWESNTPDEGEETEATAPAPSTDSSDTE